MAFEQEWNKGQLRAWEYALKFIDEGYNQSSAINAYREAGGAIRTADWGILYNQLSISAAEWTKLQYLKPTDTIPASMFAKTTVAFQNTYTYRFTANITSEFTGERVTVQRQIGSDQRLTKEELFSEIESYLIEYEIDPATTVNYITELNFFKRKG